MPRIATLLVSAADRTGIVAAISDMVFRYSGNILDADQHSEEETDTFFMRITWSLEKFTLDREGIEDAMKVLARGFENMRWRLWYDESEQQVALFCSNTPHCLYDLLLRELMGELEGRIALVVSNHEEPRSIAEHFHKPFVYIPVTKDNKQQAEAAQLAALRERNITLVVLARYMQVVSPSFIEAMKGQVINIHHSFLPAFVGARPYHQARARGVKIIGATAHYVTADLDQGPIIEQDVARVTHRDGVEDLIRKGRDLERQVLSRAVRLHLQHRILVHDNRTIIFS